MSEIPQQQLQYSKEINVTKVIKNILRLFRLLTKKWYLLLLVNSIVIPASYFLSKSLLKDNFRSNILFTLEQKSSGASGALGGLASSLGLGDLPSTSSTGMFGGENILHLVKSNRIIHESLKESMDQLNGDNLLNLYLKNHFKESLKKNEIRLFQKNLKNFRFTREMDSVLLVVTKMIKEKQILVERVDKKTTIIGLEVNDVNERWAYLFSKALINNAIDLYFEIKVGKLLRTEQELTIKKDSIRGLLDGSITTLAYETDLNSHAPLMRYKTRQAKKQVDVEVLKAMYANVIQNLELTKFQREQEEPIIELIDEPLMPLPNSKMSNLLFVLISTLLLNLIAISLFVIKNWTPQVNEA